jgi:hypothetical protein
MPLSIVTESKVIDLWVHGSCHGQGLNRIPTDISLSKGGD